MNKTFLYEKHVELGARMVDYAGFLMPVEYQGITEEHLAVRNDAGLFDVSHMGEIMITGKDALKFTNYIFTGKVNDKMKMAYGFLLNEDAGIIDDLMIYYFNDEKIMFVVNASNTKKDFAWINANKQGFEVDIKDESNVFSLLALQGPNAEVVLQNHTDFNLSELKTFSFGQIKILKNNFLISRSGYTGEGGFEIYGCHKAIANLFNVLTQSGVAPCGLGARDTLRFEAGLPLYGNEIDENVNPIEAGLKFGVDFSKDFLGKKALNKIVESGSTRKLVGLELLEPGIARQGYPIESDETEIGKITTGYLLPGTKTSYALAYVKKGYSTIGNKVHIRIRKRLVNAVIRNKKFINIK